MVFILYNSTKHDAIILRKYVVYIYSLLHHRINFRAVTSYPLIDVYEMRLPLILTLLESQIASYLIKRHEEPH